MNRYPKIILALAIMLVGLAGGLTTLHASIIASQGFGSVGSDLRAFVGITDLWPLLGAFGIIFAIGFALLVLFCCRRK